MQDRTTLAAQVPRVRCPTQEVQQVYEPWAAEGSWFTALFELLVIDWMKEASFVAVARRLNMTWDEVAGVQDRAVARGLAPRDLTKPKTIGVGETSFRKGHYYATLLTISMRVDMWPAYINSTQQHASQPEMVVGKFHIAKHLGDAVDKLRQSENKALAAESERLKKTKDLWGSSPEKMCLSR